MTLFRRFCFEATHELGDNVPSGHAYGTLHGHSFAVEIEASDGEPALLATAAEALHGRLDHQLLNISRDSRGRRWKTLRAGSGRRHCPTFQACGP